MPRKNIAYQFRNPDPGYWYLVPEDRLVAFDTAHNMWNESDGSGKYMYGFGQYRIDNPEKIRLLAWEELS